MRIKSAHIADYGCWHERELEFAAPITLFYGRNEAGKSTLMSFFRFMLYGHAARMKPEHRFDSRTGSSIGGKLVLQGKNEADYVLERYESFDRGSAAKAAASFLRLTSEQGELPPTALRDQLMGGLSADVYHHLFAFGLDELQQINVLQSDEINGYLYSAGLGIRPGVILAAERKLIAEMERLYRPRGRTQELFKAMEAQEATKQKLREWRANSEPYHALHAEWIAIDSEIGQRESEVAQLREKARWLESCISALPHWQRRLELRKALEALPAPQLTVPADALSRLEQLAAKRDELQDKLHSIEWKLKTLREQQEKLQPQSELAAQYEQLAACREAWLAGRAQSERLRELQNERANTEQELERMLRRVDRHWTAVELIAFPATAAEREHVRGQRDLLEAAERKAANAVIEAERWKSREQEHQQRAAELERLMHSKLEAGLAALGLETARTADYDTSAQLQAANQWLARLEKARGLEEEQRHLEQRQHDLLIIADAGAVGRHARWTDAVPLWLGSVLLAALPAYFLWQGQWLEAVIGSIIAAGLNAGLFTANRRAAKRMETSRESQQTLNQIQAELTSCHEALDSERTRIRIEQRELGLMNAAQFAAAASTFKESLEEDATMRTAEMLALARTLKEGLELLERERAHLHMEWEREQSTVEQCALRCLAVQADLVREEEAWAAVRERWGQWLDQCHLPETLSPDTALHIFGIIEQGQHLHAQYERIMQSEQQLQREHAQLLQRIEEQIGVTAPDKIEFELHRRLEEAVLHVKLLEEAGQLELQIQQWLQEKAAATDRIEHIKLELHNLFREVGAEDEDSFRRVIALEAERAKLGEASRHTDSLLESLAGSVAAPKLLATLTSHGPADLEAQRQDVHSELEEAGARLNDLRERKGSLRRELDRLETTEEPSVLAQRLEEETAAVQETVAAWSRRALTLALLQETRRKVEREKQPSVMSAASRYFAAMTGGRYSKVVARWEERSVYAVRRNGEHIPPVRLSRGTVEQLFISIRFALAEEQAKRCPVPFIMDDIFVNFDEERMAYAWSAVQRLAHHQQVMLFTCHESVMEAARKQLPPDMVHIQQLRVS